MDPDTQIGPLANEAQVEKFETYLEVADSEGASIVAQADLPDDPALADGHFCPPTLLEGVDNSARIAQEEVFGPMLVAIPFSSEAEAVELANDVEYGLTAAVWTEHIRKGHRIANQIEAGIVGVNHPSLCWQGLPFGGYKRSGGGRKNDFIEAMREFSRIKSIEVTLEENQLGL